MENIRKPFQGVTNIIRFNWHFYLLASCALLFLMALQTYFLPQLHNALVWVFFAIAYAIFISLFVSFYIYDVSGLYKLDWLKKLKPISNGTILNIHAGFDETSDLLQSHFAESTLLRFDFYDPKKHTEISIKRARKAFPNHSSTVSINSNQFPLPDGSINIVFIIMAAHEIRNTNERLAFFKEVKRTLKDNGQVVVIEHLRDCSNFLAYTAGVFHFFSKSSWLAVFKESNLSLQKEIKLTPFVSLFILEHGSTH